MGEVACDEQDIDRTRGVAAHPESAMISQQQCAVVAAAALGLAGTLLMFFNTWTYEPPAGVNFGGSAVDGDNVKVRARNRRRDVYQRIGLALLALSFATGGVAPFLSP